MIYLAVLPLLADSGMFPPPFVLSGYNVSDTTRLELYRQSEQRKQRQNWIDQDFYCNVQH